MLGFMQFTGIGSGGAGLQAANMQVVQNGAAGVSTIPCSLVVSINATQVCSFDSNGLYNIGPLRPGADNTYSLGQSALRWTTVYATTGTINTSNADEKEAIEPLASALPFLQALAPVSYKWKVGGNEIVDETVFESFTEQDVEEVEIDGFEIIDGRAVACKKTISRPAADRLTLHDADGNPVFNEFPELNEDGSPVLDEKGAPVVHLAQAFVEHPRMVERQRAKVERRYVERPGKRRHFGFIAQDVKKVADDLGLDWAAYVYDAESDQHGLRYDQFHALSVKGIQELVAITQAQAATIATLAARLAVLEKKA